MREIEYLILQGILIPYDHHEFSVRKVLGPCQFTDHLDAWVNLFGTKVHVCHGILIFCSLLNRLPNPTDILHFHQSPKCRLLTSDCETLTNPSGHSGTSFKAPGSRF
jgi:hypothetical protein